MHKLYNIKLSLLKLTFCYLTGKKQKINKIVCLGLLSTTVEPTEAVEDKTASMVAFGPKATIDPVLSSTDT